MKKLSKIACGVGAALFIACAHAAPPNVNPEAPDLDPDISAKILKEKAKRNPGATPLGNSGGSGSGEHCHDETGEHDRRGRADPAGVLPGGAI